MANENTMNSTAQDSAKPVSTPTPTTPAVSDPKTTPEVVKTAPAPAKAETVLK